MVSRVRQTQQYFQKGLKVFRQSRVLICAVDTQFEPAREANAFS